MRRLQRPDEVDHRRQHQDAAERRVEHELDRRVDAPLAAPDADEQEHRDQHRFPEDVEQEQVLREERAHHRELDQEDHRVEQLHVLGDRRERAGDDQRAEERRQQRPAAGCSRRGRSGSTRPRRAIHGTRVSNCRPAVGGVEARVQPGGESELHDHHRQRDPARQLRRCRAERASSSPTPSERQEQHQVEHACVRHGASSRAARRRCRAARTTRRGAGCRSAPG